jgi:hypothetical protein
MVLSDSGDPPMAKLSDTQLVILGAAAQRADLSVLPLPEGLDLKGGALNKVELAPFWWTVSVLGSAGHRLRH